MRKSLTLCLVFFATAFAPHFAVACLCPPAPAPAQILARSAAVFEGTITALTPGADYVRARVTVMRRWKAPDVAELTVGTSPSAVGSCGQDFIVGQTWLFYAQSDCGLLVSSSCTYSMPIAEAAADIAALGPPLPAGAVLPDGGAADGGQIVDAGVCGRDMSQAMPDMTPPPGPRGLIPGCAVDAVHRSQTAFPAVALVLGVGILFRRRRRSPG